MLHKIMLNGANYVSDERRSAFISTLEQNDSTPLLPDCEQPAVDEPRVENPSANGGDEPSLPTLLMPWRAHLDHPVSWKAWSEAWSDRTITRARRCVYTNTTSPTRRVTSACSHN